MAKISGVSSEPFEGGGSPRNNKTGKEIDHSEKLPGRRPTELPKGGDAAKKATK